MRPDKLRLFTSQAIDSEARAGITGDGRVDAVISTNDVARDGAEISSAGWTFENFERNPVVLFNHDDGSGGMFGGGGERASVPVIAKSTRPAVEDNTVRATALAQDVLDAIRTGHITSTSVRWLPLEHHIEKRTIKRHESEAEEAVQVLVFDRSELLEWSPVVIPSDAGAMIGRGNGDPLVLADYMQQAPPVVTPTASEYGSRQVLDPLNLIDLVDSATALIEGRDVFNAAEQAAASSLYEAIHARVVDRQRAQLTPSVAAQTASALDEIAGLFRGIDAAITVASEPIDQVRVIAGVISEATGRSVESLIGMEGAA